MTENSKPAKVKTKKKKSPPKKAKTPKLKKFTKDEKRIIKMANELIHPLGCEVTGLGSEAIGVLGDARSVGIAIIVKVAEGLDVGVMSTMITNRVRGVTRVLMDIPVEIKND